jgi:hypothetical protein
LFNSGRVDNCAASELEHINKKVLLSMRKPIVFDVSNHGFGHLAQTGPVIDAVHFAYPDTPLIVRTRHSGELVREFTKSPFRTSRPPPEATMVASSAAHIDLEASANAYSRLFADWEGRLRRELAELARLDPAAIVSNINPMSLEAGRRLGVPTIGLCCMNWLDIYRRYFATRPDASRIVEIMRRAYAGADTFIQPRPHMAMEDLPNRLSIGPIVRQGEDRREALRFQLGLPDTDHLVLVSLGGFSQPDAMDLPRMPGVHWLVRDARPHRADMTAIDGLGVPMLDLIFSADAVISKDSYCTVVEAAAAGTRLVMVPRPDWPEADCLTDWARGRCTFALAPEGLLSPRVLGDCVASVLRQPCLPPVDAPGAEQAARAIAELCGLGISAETPAASREISVEGAPAA